MGKPDGSVDLVAPGGAVARHLDNSGFAAGGERSQGFVLLMLFALSIVAVGMGLFKPNISTVVGTLYQPGDGRRDAGFTIFYAGINVGSIGGQLVAPWLVDHVGWWAGFLSVSLGLMIGYALAGLLDRRAARAGETPPYFATLRPAQAAVAVLGLAGLLAEFLLLL